MSDIRDILGVRGSGKKRELSPAAPDSDPAKEKEKKKKSKHGSYSRELSMLGSAPPIMPTMSFDGMKARRLSTQKAVKWKWMDFVNSARNDGLKLSHWTTEKDAGKEYSFTRFNKTVELPTYTDEDYKTFLHDDRWTKEQTDELMSLAVECGVRFIVMFDRLNLCAGKSMEDIKERYYEVCTKLLKNRDGVTDHPYLFVQFNKELETKRKEQQERLYTRPASLVEEEEELLKELRRIEQNRKKYTKEKTRMVRALKAVGSTAQSSSNPSELCSTTRSVSANDIVRISYAPASALVSVSPALSSRILETLSELGVPPPPDTPVCRQVYAELQQDLLMLAELQRCLALREYMVKVMLAEHISMNT